MSSPSLEGSPSGKPDLRLVQPVVEHEPLDTADLQQPGSYRSKLRKLLGLVLVDDAEADSFLGDFFHHHKKKYNTSDSIQEKISSLMQNFTEKEILNNLSDYIKIQSVPVSKEAGSLLAELSGAPSSTHSDPNNADEGRAPLKKKLRQE